MVIYVTGYRIHDGDSVAVFFVGYRDGESGTEPHPTIGSGGGEPVPKESYVSEADDICPEGAAKKIGEQITDLVDDVGAFEFSTYIAKNTNGTYGAFEDEISTNFSPSFSAHPRLDDYSQIYGIIHNHPWNSSVSDPYINYINRFPGPEDWIALQELASPTNGAVPANPDKLSVYITDPWGTTREFRYRDRQRYEQMTDSQRVAGEGLPDPVQECE